MNRKLLLALLVGVVGCNSAPESNPISSSPTTVGGKDASPSPTSTAPPASGEPTPSADPSASPSPATTASLKDIPPDLQNDAYRYYGLSNPNPLSLEFVQAVGKPNPPSMGGVATKLISMDKDSATFEVGYTGELASTLGVNTVKLDKNGIRVISSSVGKVSGDDLEIPSKVTPGATWRTKSTVQPTAGDPIQQDVTYKVVGVQKVQTKAGPYADALLVTGSGTMRIGKKTIAMTAKAWYVKDKGPVREEMTMTSPGQPPTTVTIQERKAS